MVPGVELAPHPPHPARSGCENGSNYLDSLLCLCVSTTKEKLKSRTGPGDERDERL